ncbi:hypothetical protein D3C87_1328200 [compost metagenome]
MQVLQQDPEGLGVVLAAQDVHLHLDLTVRHLQALGHAGAEGGPVRRARQGLAVEQFVQKLRMAGQVGRRPARGMQRLGDAVHRLRVLG